MNVHLQIFSLFTVFSGVFMKSGDVFEGTERDKVEIRCSYPDKYKYTPKYLCRDPCTSNHVLFKSAKFDQVESKGRYSYIDTMSATSFTVYIRDLRVSDSGIYYCGVDKWFSDKLIKVQLTVKPAPASISSPTTKNTHITSIWTTTHTSAVTNSSSHQNYSGSNEQVSSTVHSQKQTPVKIVNVAVVCAAVLVLLLFSLIVALVSLCKKRSDLKSRFSNAPTPENPVQRSPDHNQTADDIYHIYDEMVIGDSSVIYSRVGLSDPAPQVDSLYSLVTHHSG